MTSNTDTQIWPNEIRGAIFDMDGVLFDTEKVWQETWHEIANEMGVVLPEDYVYHISGTSGSVMNRVIEQFYPVDDGSGIAAECKARIAAKLKKQVPVKEGVMDILEKLRTKNIPMSIASSSTREQILSNLQISGLEDYFSGIVCGNDVLRGKPYPDIFLKAADIINIPPENCVVFEDSKNGIKAARAAGCMAVMVPDLIPADEEVKELCTRIYPDLAAVANDII